MSTEDSDSSGSLCIHTLFSPTSSYDQSHEETVNSESEYSDLHHDLDHPVSSLSVMQKMRDNNELCDVTLRVGNSVTKAHKLVLASSSLFFFSMFNADVAETPRSEIELQDMDPDALQSLVEFSYTGRILITDKNALKLLSASYILQIDSVRDACCTFLIKHLRPTNCLVNWRSAEKYFCKELSTQSRLYALKHSEAVTNCDEFLDLSFSEVEYFVSEDKLCVSSEEQVYVAVIRWIKYDLAERSQYVVQLFGHVRMAQLSKEFLFNVVCEEPLVRNDASCYEMWLDALKYQDIPEQRSDLPVKQREQRLGGLGVLAIGGRKWDTFYNSGERYDFVYDRWLPIAPLSQCRAYAGTASLGGLVYSVGGFDGKFKLCSNECYDPISNKWSPIKSLDSERLYHGISAIDGLLYVCGGFDGSTCLSSVERYDPLTDVWSSCPSMTTPRWGCCLCVVNNCLYAIGGDRDDSNYLSSVEMYDPRSSKWLAVPDMIEPRSYFSAATLDDTLYCVGGNNSSSSVCRTGERFNVRRNVWEPIAPMKCWRSSHGMVAVNGGLLVLGGRDGKSYLNTTEQYDPRNDQWTIGTPMGTHRGFFGAVLVNCSDLESELTLSSKYSDQS